MLSLAIVVMSAWPEPGCFGEDSGCSFALKTQALDNPMHRAQGTKPLHLLFSALQPSHAAEALVRWANRRALCSICVVTSYLDRYSMLG
jgi:hypothetical protein